MIVMITGRPGAGKTYETVRYHIIPALREGRKVITNIPINLDVIKRIYEVKDESLKVVEYNFHDYGNKRPFSDPSEYKDEWRNKKGQGPLYVVDEAHLSLPKGKSAGSMLEFLTMHRHSGVDIAFVTQNPRQMDRDILNLVDVVHYCVKNRMLGDDSTYTKKVKDGYRGEIISIQQRKYQPLFFKAYKSHTMSAGSVTESKAKDMKGIRDHWSFKLYKPVIGLGILFMCYSAYGLFPDSDDEKEDPQIYETDKAKLVFDEPEPIEPPPFHRDINVQSAKYIDDGLQVGTQRGEAVQEEPKEIEHPYSAVNMHVVGYVESPTDAKKSAYLFLASEQGQGVFYIKQTDLIDAGYVVQSVNPCMAVIKYGEEYEQTLLCDSPTVATNMLN